MSKAAGVKTVKMAPNPGFQTTSKPLVGKPKKAAAATVALSDAQVKEFHETMLGLLDSFVEHTRTGPMKPSVPVARKPKMTSDTDDAKSTTSTTTAAASAKKHRHPLETELYYWVSERQREWNDETIADWLEDAIEERLKADKWSWFDWDPTVTSYKVYIQLLAHYWAENKAMPRTLAPRDAAMALPNEYKLSLWMNRCRAAKRNGKMPNEIEAQINAQFGDRWDWTPDVTKAEEMVDRIKEFYTSHKSLAPKLAKGPECRDEYEMAAWLNKTRRAHASGTNKAGVPKLDPDIKDMVDTELPWFDWTMRARGRSAGPAAGTKSRRATSVASTRSAKSTKSTKSKTAVAAVPVEQASDGEYDDEDDSAEESDEEVAAPPPKTQEKASAAAPAPKAKPVVVGIRRGHPATRG